MEDGNNLQNLLNSLFLILNRMIISFQKKGGWFSWGSD